MLSVATIAYATDPKVKQIVLFERTPMFDNLQDLDEFANQDLHSQ